jgi:hypothetical protein
MFSFSLLIDPPSVDMLEGPPSASEVIEQARSLTKLATTGQRNRQRRNAPERWNVQNVTWRDVQQPAVPVVVVGHEQAGAEVRLVEEVVVLGLLVLASAERPARATPR